MRKLIAIIMLLAVNASSSMIMVAGQNAVIVYCGGGINFCANAYGTPVPDLSTNGNWTLHWRMHLNDFSATVGTSQFHIFAAETFTTSGGLHYTCGQAEINHFVDSSTSSDRIQIFVPIAGGLSNTSVLLSSINLWADQAWHDYTLTHDSSHNWKLYVDGALDTSVNVNNASDSACDVFIGENDGANSCGTTTLPGGDKGCWMMDWSAWSVVLPLNDIKALASGASRPNLISSNPDWWYAMDAGLASGPAFGPDDSGNLHTLKFESQPRFDYSTAPLFATNSSVSPPTGEATH